MKTALWFADPLEFLVATMLSAQCTDARVNIVTKELFKKYRTPEDYANADVETFENEIRSTGFYRNKAKNIMGANKVIMERFNSKVPDNMEELTRLPGVARKTANIVLSNAYGKIEGIAVDTHVKRLSKRLGLTKNRDPNKIEQDLMKIIPKEEWSNLSHLLIFHGRAICQAKKPRCEVCVLNWFCPSSLV
ncbi:MAG: endonuclease III [Candidatus Hydrothermarchaeales archaeon]